jgi:uncharacterized protein with NRDE domain
VCTLVVAWQVFADTPVTVAANRDEATDRPAEPPAWHDGDPAVLAPTDSEAGGTWLGVNDSGVLAAITNRWTDTDIGGERSRGLLTRDALAHESAAAAARFVERALDEHAYAGFNLVVADDRAAILVEWDGQASVRPFRPGLHVVTNVGADGDFRIPERRADAGQRQAESAGRLTTALTPEPGEDAQDWLDRAGVALGDHEYGVCVHGDGFGTRSASLVGVGSDGITYRYADGPPCRTAFETVVAGDGARDAQE